MSQSINYYLLHYPAAVDIAELRIRYNVYSLDRGFNRGGTSPWYPLHRPVSDAVTRQSHSQHPTTHQRLQLHAAATRPRAS
jgi:hypothetical protein